MRVAVRWASEELVGLLAMLSPQQARGVVRIVQAELEGQSLSSLLDNPEQICTSTTYYGSGKRRGWKDKPEFQQALKLARRDYRQWMLEHGTAEALTILSTTAPDAARALRQQIVGDRAAMAALEMALCAQEPDLRANAARRLGETGQAVVVPALWAALRREKELDVQKALVTALGQIAGWRDPDTRAAAGGVLNRAAGKTAAKLGIVVGEMPEDVTDDELEAIEKALREQAEGGSAAE